MYGAEVGYERNDMPQQAIAVGVHNQLSDLAKRINAVSSVIENMQARLTGPRPTEGNASQKSEREPSTKEFASMCHSGMARIEKQLSELGNSIG